MIITTDGRRSATLRLKLLATVCGLVLLAVACFSVLSVRARTAELEAELLEKALLYAKVMRAQLEPAVAFDDRQTAREVLASMHADDDVVGTALYAASGSALATEGDIPATLDASPLGPGTREARAQVTSREGPTGVVVVRVSDARLQRARRSVLVNTLVAAFTALVLSLVVSWWLASKVTTRLGHIAQAAKRVALGDFSAAPVDPGAGDEIGTLTLAFNTMREHLQRLMNQMQKAAQQEQDKLAALVRERTREIERRNAELTDSREQYRLITESTNTVPFEFDLVTNRFTYIGPQCEGTFGFTQTQCMAPNFVGSLIHPDDLPRIGEAFGKAMAAKQGFESELRVKVKGGAVKHVRAVSSFAAGERPFLRGLFLDVTDFRRLESELAQAQKLESIGRLASGVAHEINTPIQYVGDSVHFVRDAWNDVLKVVNGYRELKGQVLRHEATPEAVNALDELEQASDMAYLETEMPKAIDSAQDGLHRVAEIVRSMKAFAHPDVRSEVMVDVNKGIASTVTIAKNEYKYVADLETKLGTLPGVKGHPGELNQVILNLVVNAAHAIGDVVKGTSNRGKITVTTQTDPDGWARISVQDTGAGIPDAIKDKIFEQFFTTKPVGQGTGQGLALARSVIDRHHGQLTFESQVGVGTTFTIRLPPAGTEVAKAA